MNTYILQQCLDGWKTETVK